MTALIETKRPDNYDAAVALLSDLKSVSARTGEQQKFTKRVEQLREAHRRKPSLLERFDRAGLCHLSARDIPDAARTPR